MSGGPTEPQRKRRKWPYFLLAFVVLGIAGAILFPDRDVPSVVGLTYAEADRRLAAADLGAQSGSDNAAATAKVCRQDPSPGDANATKGDDVELFFGADCKPKIEENKAEEKPKPASGEAAESDQSDGTSADLPDDPSEITCADLGIDNPDAAGGEDLESDADALIAAARPLGSVFTQGTEEEKTKAAGAALATICVKASSPSERPVEEAKTFLRAAMGGGESSPETLDSEDYDAVDRSSSAFREGATQFGSDIQECVAVGTSPSATIRCFQRAGGDFRAAGADYRIALRRAASNVGPGACRDSLRAAQREASRLRESFEDIRAAGQEFGSAASTGGSSSEAADRLGAAIDDLTPTQVREAKTERRVIRNCQ